MTILSGSILRNQLKIELGFAVISNYVNSVAAFTGKNCNQKNIYNFVNTVLF
jgi:hypothetical protein